MFIRSIGTVLVCLQHSYEPASRSISATLPPKVLPSTSISLATLSSSGRLIHSIASTPSDKPKLDLKDGVGDDNLNQTTLDPTISKHVPYRTGRKKRDREHDLEPFVPQPRIRRIFGDLTATELRREHLKTAKRLASGSESPEDADKAGRNLLIHQTSPRTSDQSASHSFTTAWVAGECGSYVPTASQAFDEHSPYGLETWKLAQRKRWADLYGRLAFPEDGDVERARKDMAGFQTSATRILASPRRRSRIAFTEKMESMVDSLIGGLVQSAESTLLLMWLLDCVPAFGWHIRRDCLIFLKKVYWSEIEAELRLRKMYDTQIDKLFNGKRWPKVLTQNMLLVMLSHSVANKRQAIIDAVRARYDPLHLQLLLGLVDYYTKEGQPGEAIDILSRIPLEDLKSEGSKLNGRYRNLINIDTVERNSSGLNFQLLPKLVDIGLPLTHDMHNSVLERAVTLGLPDIAWEVYRFMEANQIEVDPRRYLVLLKDSFQRGDLDGLNLIMSQIHQRRELFKNPFLVSYTMNIVRQVCYYERQLPVTDSLEHILAVYDRAYDRGPLVKLGIADPLPSAGKDSALAWPDGIQLSFTLWTYMLVQRFNYRISHLWRHFVRLVELGDPDMCAAASHDVLYNGAILCWGRRKETLMEAVEVLEDMERLGLCPPSELTWALLISGFMKHGELAAAENIRQMMITRGFKGDPKIWESLLKMYPESEMATQIEEDLNR